MSRSSMSYGGSRIGDWRYCYHGSANVFAGRISKELCTVGEWLPLRSGEALLLATVKEPDGGLSNLSVWCFPADGRFGFDGLPEEDWPAADAASEQWMKEHPPVVR